MLSPRRTAWLVFPLFLFCAAIAPAQTQTPAPAAARLARQILAATGPRPSLRMTFENRSSLGIVQATALRRAVEQALGSGGARLGAGAKSPIDVHVTLSESWRNLLLSAQIQVTGGEQVVMVPFPRSEPAAGGAGSGATVLSLRRHLVFSQAAPMLSFLQWVSTDGKSSYFAVLEPGRLALYRRDRGGQGQWQPLGSATVPHSGPWPRDSRGLLWMTPVLNLVGGVPGPVWLHAALPGVHCSLPVTDAGNHEARLVGPDGSVPLTCRPAGLSGAPWPIFEGSDVLATAALRPGGNFFGAAIQRSAVTLQLSPFYSAAVVHDDRDRRILLTAGLDGKAGLYDDAGNQLGSIDGWGSDVAGIHSGCGRGWQVLADKPGDWTQNDAVTAYEIVEGKAVAVAEPVNFSGPVTALAPTPGGLEARAVEHNRDTNLYDAYTITLACGR